MSEEHSVVCPACHRSLSAAAVAALLPDEVIAIESARRNGRRQSPHAGPGRPRGSRCPGCGRKMKSAKLREHRAGCVRGRVEAIQKNLFRVRVKLVHWTQGRL